MKSVSSAPVLPLAGRRRVAADYSEAEIQMKRPPTEMRQRRQLHNIRPPSQGPTAVSARFLPAHYAHPSHS
jgi:hypothetical protein